MAEHDPGQSLDLDIAHRSALDLGEIADLGLREFDVVDRLRRDLGDQCLDLVRRSGESSAATICRSAPTIRAPRRRRVGDIGDDGFDRAADFGIGFFLLAGECGLLDVPGHHPFSTIVGSSLREARRATKQYRPYWPGL